MLQLKFRQYMKIFAAATFFPFYFFFNFSRSIPSNNVLFQVSLKKRDIASFPIFYFFFANWILNTRCLDLSEICLYLDLNLWFDICSADSQSYNNMYRGGIIGDVCRSYALKRQLYKCNNPRLKKVRVLRLSMARKITYCTQAISKRIEATHDFRIAVGTRAFPTVVVVRERRRETARRSKNDRENSYQCRYW